jgi:ATP-dependent helicase/nuclease subunit A
MSTGPVDRPAREAALDCRRSFIVQAPAGSGKTELLIQRYLSLLTSVEQPEQVVAITFTRKAAAEMRGRIIEALARAAAGALSDLPHQRVTDELARAVLDRDRGRSWGLLAQPQRMRIDTLDALNAWLARQLPILSGGVAGAEIVEDASDAYRRAAERTLDQLESSGAVATALRSLLGILGNSIERLEILLAAQLPKRDQWLRHFSGSTNLRAELEAGLRNLVADELRTLASRAPQGLFATLAPLLRQGAGTAANPRVRLTLAPWLEIEAAPDDPDGALEAWRGVACLLLTQQGRWRRDVTKNEGFWPGDPLKGTMRAQLAALAAGDDRFRDALAAAGKLPEPRYSDAQWQDVAALRTVLVHAAAELRVIFSERRCVDFVELALSAQQALGRVDEPSELLLALDSRIQHLLVDEFQDTSQTQLRLLELLTSGWQPGDGRTLFVVGDPMQSIYRFRDADMSLFLRVKRHGVGAVPCELVVLESNFRSAPALVDWVNRTFAEIFPREDQVRGGAARFFPSRAHRSGLPAHGVELHLMRADDGAPELERVVEILERERAADAGQSIAVLVQSRSHLAGLQQRLQARGWPVHAVEIDAITERQIGQDLIGLTRALLHLGDRIAWLSVLRAPWCGLRWRDLHELCADAPDETVWELLHDPRRAQRQSADTARRIAFVRATLTRAFEHRSAQPFARWVESTWEALDGPACISTDELALAERFFKRLNAAPGHGERLDVATLDSYFSQPQGQGDAPRETGIEIMTIHRAKGLEFDTVIAFGLARAPRGEDARALYWMERSREDGAADLVVAPLPRTTDRLTELLKTADRELETAERARLLYVATTRARHRLHLVAALKPDQAVPPPRSLLACLWPQIRDRDELAVGIAATTAAEPRIAVPRLRRLADGFDRVPAATAVDAVQAVPTVLERTPEYAWVGQTAVRVGTLVHRELQRIASRGLESIEQQVPRFRGDLELLGVVPEELDAAVRRVQRALRGAIEDPRGRWILGPHSEARSELRLTIRGPGGLEHIQLDRTFVDAGVRWIIDFKTSMHEGGEIETFLDSEVARYESQLEQYAATMARLDRRPIRVGLYFPLLRAFRDWSPLCL